MVMVTHLSGNAIALELLYRSFLDENRMGERECPLRDTLSVQRLALSNLSVKKDGNFFFTL